MTRLIISTCTRAVSSDMPSGHLYSIDLERLKVLQKTAGIEPPYRQLDLNPRGGMRGLKGMSLRNTELVVANYSVLFFFDCKWNLLQTMTHPSISGLHEIYYAADGIWVTSSVNDLIARFDLHGKLSEFDYIRSYESLMWQLGGPPRQLLTKTDILEPGIDFRNPTQNQIITFDRTHLNGIDMLPDGRIVISLGLIVGDLFSVLEQMKSLMRRLGIWQTFLALNRRLRSALGLKKQMLSELVIQPPIARSAIICGRPKDGWRTCLQFQVAQNPSHSPRFLEDGTGYYLDSSHGRLLHFDGQGNLLSNPVITEKFLRGLLPLPNGQLAIGAGNTLLMYDLLRKEVVDELTLTEDGNVSIFDIKVLPENFDLPPESLQAKFGRIVGFDRSNIIWDR